MYCFSLNSIFYFNLALLRHFYFTWKTERIQRTKLITEMTDVSYEKCLIECSLTTW